MTSALRLRPVRASDEQAVCAAQSELAADGFVFALGYDAGVPFPTYARMLGGVVVGRTSIRHELNDFLLREGGYIGYGVRPAYRRRGYASGSCGRASSSPARPE